MSHLKKFIISILLCIPLLITAIPSPTVSASASDAFSFILLSQYSATADIGNEIYLLAITSNGKMATWKSSDSKIASVNTYGVVTAKKAGTVKITAKISKAEASCLISVNKTKLTLSSAGASIEHGETMKLSAKSSNDSEITWKSSKKSIATVDDNGTVTGLKPGETIITAKADDTTVSCKVKVKSPTVKLNKTSVDLYRNHTVQLTASVSSGIAPVWKTSKKSVAVVDETGMVTGIKNGTAIISATVDGVIKNCTVTVRKPDITISQEEVTLKTGGVIQLTASVSSKNPPVWSTSNTNFLEVTSDGKITALKKGTAYVYASEDGTKVKCTVKVTE